MHERASVAMASILLGVSVGGWAGCSDLTEPDHVSDPEPTGAITVHTSTWGRWADADGYVLSVDGSLGQKISLHDSVTVGGLEPGEHEVALTEVSGDCFVEGSNPRIVSVGLGTSRTTFRVNCTAPAITLTLISGQDQVGRPGEPLAEPLVVRVTDDAGLGIAGVSVDWRITGGDGTLESSFSPERRLPVRETATLTDGEGLARVPMMPLAFETLDVTAHVYAADGSPVTFLVDATDMGASMTVVSGSDQPAQAGRQLEEPLVLLLTDGRGEPVSHVRVEWRVESGDGDLGRDQLGSRARSDTTRTDADGLARVSLTPTWFGPVEASASTVGVSGSPLTFTADATDPGAGLSIVSGNEQDGKSAELLREPLVVLATDGLGNPAPNVRVSWSVTQGAGSFKDWPHFPFLDVANNRGSWQGGSYTDGQGLARVGFVPRSLGIVAVGAALSGSDREATFTTEVDVLVISYSAWYDFYYFGHWNCSRWTGTSGDYLRSCLESAVPVGTTVEWVNHVAGTRIASTSRPPNGDAFDSGVLGTGERFRFVPTVVGTWEYADANRGVTSILRVY